MYGSDCMFVHHVFIYKSLQNSEKGVISPGSGVTGSCDPPCGCWELNLFIIQGIKSSAALNY